MTIRKKVFTSQKITVIAGGNEFRVQALISSYGAKYVFEEDEIPAELLGRLGEEIQIQYKNIPVKTRVVKEITGFGTIYNLRFINPSNTLLKQIDRDLKESGLPSPWMRGLPRLTTETKHLPVPSLLVLYHKGQTYFLNINNFTLGGLQAEFVGPDLRDVKFGTKFELDLVTNSGDKIPDLNGLVTHVTVEINFDGNGSDKYVFGVKVLGMPLGSENKFRGLIREHCIGLKSETPAL